jgi:hypothetical protein
VRDAYVVGRDLYINLPPGGAAGVWEGLAPHVRGGDSGRVDAGLVGRWECVAAAGGISESQGRCDISGSHFVQLGADGRGKHTYDRWRRSLKDPLGSPLRELLGLRCELLLDGTCEFSYTACDGTYNELPDAFAGEVRWTCSGVRVRKEEEAWRTGKATEARYLVNGDMLTLYSPPPYSGAWRTDYRRCEPG